MLKKRFAVTVHLPTVGLCACQFLLLQGRMGCGNESALACKELADFHGFPSRGCLEAGEMSALRRPFPLLFSWRVSPCRPRADAGRCNGPLSVLLYFS